jgi:arylsulfatase A-like enzyme
MPAPIRLSLASATSIALAWLAVACTDTSTPEPALRIVLVTLDTLRFEPLDPDAPKTSPMPRTRALAVRGAWFADSWAASSATQPTHATLFTGLHPWQHGVPRNGTILGAEHHTVAERLREAGFTTAAVIASFPLDPRYGFDQGFDVYEHSFDRVLHRKWAGEEVEHGRFYQLDESVTEQALRLLDRAEGSRQFFWFHYFDGHSPYGDRQESPLHLPRLFRYRRDDPALLDRELERARLLYELDLRRLDASLGVLFDRLDADAHSFETHIIVTSDHGESFGESGALGHGDRVTQEQVRVPLIIDSPRVEAGVRRDRAGTADLAVTLLSLAGLETGGLPGRDLTRRMPAGTGTAVGMNARPIAALDPASSEKRHRFYVVRENGLYAGDGDSVVFGDVPGRRVEDRNLEASLGELFHRFDAALAGEAVEEQLDPESREALRALGYLQ